MIKSISKFIPKIGKSRDTSASTGTLRSPGRDRDSPTNEPDEDSAELGQEPSAEESGPPRTASTLQQLQQREEEAASAVLIGEEEGTGTAAGTEGEAVYGYEHEEWTLYHNEDGYPYWYNNWTGDSQWADYSGWEGYEEQLGPYAAVGGDQEQQSADPTAPTDDDARYAAELQAKYDRECRDQEEGEDGSRRDEDEDQEDDEDEDEGEAASGDSILEQEDEDWGSDEDEDEDLAPRRRRVAPVKGGGRSGVLDRDREAELVDAEIERRFQKFLQSPTGKAALKREKSVVRAREFEKTRDRVEGALEGALDHVKGAIRALVPAATRVAQTSNYRRDAPGRVADCAPVEAEAVLVSPSAPPLPKPDPEGEEEDQAENEAAAIEALRQRRLLEDGLGSPGEQSRSSESLSPLPGGGKADDARKQREAQEEADRRLAMQFQSSLALREAEAVEEKSGQTPPSDDEGSSWMARANANASASATASLPESECDSHGQARARALDAHPPGVQSLLLNGGAPPAPPQRAQLSPPQPVGYVPAQDGGIPMAPPDYHSHSAAAAPPAPPQQFRAPRRESGWPGGPHPREGDWDRRRPGPQYASPEHAHYDEQRRRSPREHGPSSSSSSTFRGPPPPRRDDLGHPQPRRHAAPPPSARSPYAESSRGAGLQPPDAMHQHPHQHLGGEHVQQQHQYQYPRSPPAPLYAGNVYAPTMQTRSFHASQRGGFEGPAPTRGPPQAPQFSQPRQVPGRGVGPGRGPPPGYRRPPDAGPREYRDHY